jgi:nitroreductase
VKIIIAAEKAKDRLVSEALGIPPVRNRWASRAPVIAVFAVDRDLVVHRIASGLRKIYYDFIDAGIAGEHFVLQATELGLGTCWLGWFRKKQVSEILRLPGNWRVCAMITLGFPDESPGEKRIIPESESVLFRYGGNDE